MGACEMTDEDILVHWFKARIHDSDTWQYSYPRPVDVTLESTTDEMMPWPPTDRVPCKEIVMAPHQYERLLGVLGEITKPEMQLMDNSHPMVRYSERLLRQQEYERNLRRENPILQGLWDQYQTALKLCR